MAIKSVSIRIEEEMLKKISYVADFEGRSVNSHILSLIRREIKEFERENGEIDINSKSEGKIPPELNIFFNVFCAICEPFTEHEKIKKTAL